MTEQQSSKLSYQDAGVDIDKGNAFVETVKTAVKSTHNAQVLGGIGGFAACFELDLSNIKQPILTSCTDGVGTKLKIAHQLNNHRTIGIDLVAMCANDLIVNGSKPLFFLDYYATGKLDLAMSQAIIEGIAEGCSLANMSLVGGETAEMPGFYDNGHYDLAGFSVGVVDKARMLDGSRVQVGDVLIGLQSSGFHSNGYSLIRKLIETEGLSLDAPLGSSTLGEHLLKPTQIYVACLLPLFDLDCIHACAHITGGGLAENLARVLPDNVGADIQLGSWQKPIVYDWLDQFKQIEMNERLRTYNEGLGMILCVPEKHQTAILQHCQAHQQNAFVVGQIRKRQAAQPAVEIR